MVHRFHFDPARPLLTDLPDLQGKAIAVTGGTGSFGQAFVARLLRDFAPAKVVVFSRDEQKHHAMQLQNSDPRLRFFIGDVRDRDRLRLAFRGIDIVVHAAAMKHVPLAEYNPIEAIRTNIDGAANLVDAAIERGVSRVVALSTDKACSPINLYGATKLCMEKLLVAANSYSGGQKTQFDLVRYGNVVGSKGSVVPNFLEQRKTGRITLTEPAMTRFWIGMDEAVDLVLLALRDARGGETFIPKLPACTVQTLADVLGEGCEQVVTGARPGEKMHEALISDGESHNIVEYDRHFVLLPGLAWRPGSREDGQRLASGVLYASDRTVQLDAQEVQALLQRLGFLTAAAP